MSADNKEAGAGLAVFSVVGADYDYKNNSYIIRLTLENFTTTDNAVLHDYYFPALINPLISDMY